MSSAQGKSLHDQPVVALSDASPGSVAGGAPTFDAGVSVTSGCVGATEGVSVCEGGRVALGISDKVGADMRVSVGKEVDERIGVFVGAGMSVVIGDGVKVGVMV